MPQVEQPREFAEVIMGLAGKENIYRKGAMA
jgi:hypothetical protein